MWAHENIQTASRWSFCGDPRVNNGIKKGYFPTVPDSCTMVCKTAPKFVPVQRSSKMYNPLTQPSLCRFLDEGTYTDGLKSLLIVGQNWNKVVFIEEWHHINTSSLLPRGSNKNVLDEEPSKLELWSCVSSVDPGAAAADATNQPNKTALEQNLGEWRALFFEWIRNEPLCT